MAWHRVGERAYFYRPVRVGSSVRRVYVGTGPVAELAADLDAARRDRRRARDQAFRAEEARRAQADALLDNFVRLAEALSRAALVAAGYRQHCRGAWRRRRAMTTAITNGNTTAAKPAPSGPPPSAPGPDERGMAEHLRRLVGRAEQGDTTVMPELRAALDADPSLWRGYCDVGALAEAAWLKLASGGNLMLYEALRRHVQELRAEVAGADPSPLERLLADRVAVCWLQCAECDAVCGTLQTATTPGHMTLLRRQNGASKRLLQAIKVLASVRRLLRPPVSPVQVATRLGGDPIGGRRNSPSTAAAEAVLN